jgi:sugar/nucleoside kinase (ribokinase family)
MTRRFDVIVVGNYSLDLIFTGLPRFPVMGQDTIGSGFAMLPGEAFTHAVAMHRLGIKVGWAADFGNDDFSRFTLEKARTQGLDESLFVHHKKPMRRISVAMSYPQDRAFVTYYDPDPSIPAAIKALAGASARLVYLPGFYFGPYLESSLKLMRLKKMKLVMDGNADNEVVMSVPAVVKAIRAADVFLPNASEARRMTGELDLEKAMRRLGEYCQLVVVKDGPNGAHAWDGEHLLHSPAIAVKPVDTTGAGDCFNAGFIKAWLDGLSLPDCLRWGNIVGGLSTLGMGGTGQKVTEEDVRAYLKKHMLAEGKN